MKLKIPQVKQNASVILGIRSEDITVGPDQDMLARVHDVENHGVEKIVTLRVDNQYFKATTPLSLALQIDGVVKFSFNPKKLHMFDRTTGSRL